MRDWDGDATIETGSPTRRQAAPRRRNSRWGLILGVGAVGAAAFAGLMLFGKLGATRIAGDQSIPLIQADPRPIKIRPEDPGGMEVPHQDKLVFDRLDPDAAPPLVERLLPPPEAPLPRPAPPPPPAPSQAAQTPAPQTSAPQAAAMAPTAGEGSLPTETVPMAPPPHPVATDPGLPVPVFPAPRPPAPAPQAATPPVPPRPVPPPPVPAAATTGNFRIQLASVRSEADAKSEWQRLSGRYKEVLSGLTLHVARADLGGDRGIVYRIQAGFFSEARARELCGQLAAQKVGCFVVRP
ncbi:MAG: SPOR domain-containing protein [Azospirillum sp.]|nr:SPOR domain-containing protein [Azospirillum sp.]